MPQPEQVASQVKQHIYSNWQDQQVASWVIDQLPLLPGPYSDPVPIYNLQLEFKDAEIIQNTKLVTSGGYEGTHGHIFAANEINEARTLTYNTQAGLLLEPDQYIYQKGRPPLLTQDQRATLWSHTNYFDFICKLPYCHTHIDPDTYYQNIHNLFQSAIWCTSVEHHHLESVIMRGRTIDVQNFQVIPRQPCPSASFLYATHRSSPSEVNLNLFQYLHQIMYQSSPHLLNFNEHHLAIFNRYRISE